MDPLSITATAINLVQIGRSLMDRLLSSTPKSSAFFSPSVILEIGIYVDLLNEISEISVGAKGTLPHVTRSCVQLCEERIRTLEAISKSKRSSSKETEKAAKEFMRSVKVLRDIVMDAVTHMHLIETQHRTQDLRKLAMASLELNQNQSLLIHDLQHTAAQSSAPEGEQYSARLDELSKKLHSMAQNTTIDDPQWQADNTSPFSMTVTVICTRDEGSEHTVARANIDTQSAENWISMELLTRAKIEDELGPVDNSRTYVGFGGGLFEPMGKIDVTWFAANPGKSRKTTFLVHEVGPFDMILGCTWIAEDSYQMLNKGVFALRMAKFTKEEHRIIEENARRKGATREQLASIRRAEEASARDRLRQQKAASTASRSPNPVSTTSLIPAQSLHPGGPEHLRLPARPSARLSANVSTQSIRSDSS